MVPLGTNFKLLGFFFPGSLKDFFKFLISVNVSGQTLTEGRDGTRKKRSLLGLGLCRDIANLPVWDEF